MTKPKKSEEPKPFTDFKIRPLTLKEREICSNQAMEFKSFFTQILIWIRYGLIELKGIKITENNFDEEVNKFSDQKISDISFAIREATQFPDKKKDS